MAKRKEKHNNPKNAFSKSHSF